MRQGAYRLLVPDDGEVSVRNIGLLYGWPETACFMNGTEIPIQVGSRTARVIPNDEVVLRSLGTFSANGLTFAAFHVGTQIDFDMDRFADVAPLLPEMILVRNHRLPRSVIGEFAILAILLVCLGLVSFRLIRLKLATP